MAPRLRKCDEVAIAGRLRKAEQFMEGGETIREFASDESDIGDAYVTLCIHAGIAAADVICCIALGAYAQGEDHSEAVAHLSSVRPDGKSLGNSLRTLLMMKSRAGYSHERVSTAECKRAQRAAEKLLGSARERRISG
jgi:hypothetical protein